MSFKNDIIKSYKIDTQEQLEKIDRECSILKKKGKIAPMYRNGNRFAYMDGNSAITFKQTIVDILLETRCIGKHRLSKFLVEIFGVIKDPYIYDAVLNDLERDNVIHQITAKKWSRKTKHIQKEFELETTITPRATHRIVLGKIYYRKIKIENILKEKDDV